MGQPRLARFALCLLLASLASMPAFAEPAMDWVKKMSNAMRNLNYQGDFVYLHDNRLEGMQISHYKDANGEKERLISLNGEAREVIRDNQNLTCIWPSSQKVIVDVSRNNSFSPIFIPENIGHLEQFYEIKMAGEGRVADSNAVIVHIDPRDEFRYGMKFWIDRDNGLMLKSSLLDENGGVIEEVMFTSLRVFEAGEGPVIDTMPPIDDNFTLIRYHSGESAGTQTSDRAWKVAEMPAGFRSEESLRRKVAGSEDFVQQMVYSDGLASLSIFIEEHSGEAQNGMSSMGAVNAYIRVQDNFSITAIGEVPALTVKRFAESIVYEAQ